MNPSSGSDENRFLFQFISQKRVGSHFHVTCHVEFNIFLVFYPIIIVIFIVFIIFFFIIRIIFLFSEVVQILCKRLTKNRNFSCNARLGLISFRWTKANLLVNTSFRRSLDSHLRLEELVVLNLKKMKKLLERVFIRKYSSWKFN